MSRTLLHLTIALATAAAPLAAQTPQPVRIVGVLQSTPAGLGLAFTDVQLQNATPASSLVGKAVDIRGFVTPGVTPPRIDVIALERSLAEFRLGGLAQLGRPLTLRVDDPDGAWWYTFFSVASGFLPLAGILPVVDGTVLLDLSQTATIDAGPMLLGTWQGRLLVPNDPRLIGCPIRFQAAVGKNDGTILYLNTAADVIRP